MLKIQHQQLDNDSGRDRYTYLLKLLEKLGLEGAQFGTQTQPPCTRGEIRVSNNLVGDLVVGEEGESPDGKKS